MPSVIDGSQMQDAVALAAQYDADVLCEEFIEGIELTCPVLGEGTRQRCRFHQPARGEQFVNGLVVSLEHEEVRPGPRP